MQRLHLTAFFKFFDVTNKQFDYVTHFNSLICKLRNEKTKA